MMALSAAIEPLRAANRLLGRTGYAWTLAAERAGAAMASNGLEIKAGPGAEDGPDADLTVVVASLFPGDLDCPGLFARLRRLRSRGRAIGAISNGTMLLARAGVLRDSRVTIHWEMARQLQEAYPDLTVSADLYCQDSGVLTAAGGTAAMDMMLSLIAQIDGGDLALDVARQFLHGPIRPASDTQMEDLRWRFRITDRRLLNAVELMRRNLSSPARIGWIAEKAGVSERQLERLFLAELASLPSDFYMALRLRAAREMLLASSDPLELIAEQCGFSSAGHFSRSYKIQFGEPPSLNGVGAGSAREAGMRSPLGETCKSALASRPKMT